MEKNSRYLIIGLFVILAVIDLILVFNKFDYPTFSKVVKENRSNFIWLTFVYGGLVSKVFYNRIVSSKSKEKIGVIGFVLIAIILFAIGINIEKEKVPEYLQIALLVFGGAYNYLFWPQYRMDHN